MVIGNRLKELRESKNLSQGDIEKRTGLLRCYISRAEKRSYSSSYRDLERWHALSKSRCTACFMLVKFQQD